MRPSDPDSLLRRIRWGRAGALCAALTVAAGTVLWPHGAPPPQVPDGAAVPLVVRAEPIAPPPPPMQVKPRRGGRRHPARRPPRRHHRRRRAARTGGPNVPRRPAPSVPVQRLPPAPIPDPEAEFTPAHHEFGG